MLQQKARGAGQKMWDREKERVKDIEKYRDVKIKKVKKRKTNIVKKIDK